MGDRFDVDPELAAAYPGLRLVLAWGEQSHVVWETARRGALSPARVVADCRRLILQMVAVTRLVPRPGAAERVAAMREEMDHPDFARYVAAKLGSI